MSTLLSAPEAHFAFIDQIRDRTLTNGLRLLILPRPEIPSVALALWLPGAGSIHDPAGREGLANFTARGIGDGTPQRTKHELDEAIDFVGGSYQFSAGMEGASGGMQFLSEHLPLAVELLADTLQHSHYPAEEVERGRKQIAGSLTAQLERPGDLCERAYLEAVFANSDYGHNIDGTLESLATLDREQLVAFHGGRYRPAGAVLVIVGALDATAMELLITDRFGSWSAAGYSDTGMPSTPQALPGIQTVLIDRPVQQANIRLGWLSLPRMHPDYYPLLMMNYIFGASSLSSRIATTVRDNQGLAYQVVSRYAAMEQTGLMTLVLQTSNATAAQALTSLREEMRRMQEAPVELAELEDAVSFFRDRFPLTIETNGSMAGQLATIARYGFPLTHFREHLEAISAVTREDIQRAAQLYLQPDAFQLTAVANLAEAQLEQALT